jgi:hypothetical protein
MSFDFWRTFMGGLFPENLACRFVQTVNPPDVFGCVTENRPSTSGAALKIDLGIAAYRGGHKYPVAPDYRARVTKTGNRSLPSDVL